MIQLDEIKAQGLERIRIEQEQKLYNLQLEDEQDKGIERLRI